MSMPGDLRPEPPHRIDTRLLVVFLAINASMFLVEAAIDWFAQSTALLADSLDMLPDAAVFAIALLAVGRSARFKTHAAFSTGVFQLVLGFAVAVDVLRRFALWQRAQVFLYGRNWSPCPLCKSIVHGSSAEASLWRGAYSC
jgi:Co/Zn/Cd efflux system component